jgi:hypothetical protein
MWVADLVVFLGGRSPACHNRHSLILMVGPLHQFRKPQGDGASMSAVSRLSSLRPTLWHQWRATAGVEDGEDGCKLLPPFRNIRCFSFVK